MVDNSRLPAEISARNFRTNGWTIGISDMNPLLDIN
jgi:hypothetical protein